MTEVYPFFRDEDERTLAVIGEEAVAADLNGVYQKPYAVLTSSRLYCKGNRLSGNTTTHGNFIVDIADISSARISSPTVKNSWAVWIIAGLFLVSCVLLILNTKLTLQRSHDPEIEMLMMMKGVQNFYQFINPTFYIVLASAGISVIVTVVALCARRNNMVVIALTLYPIVSLLCWIVTFMSLPLGVNIGYIAIYPATFTSLTPNILNAIIVLICVLYYKSFQRPLLPQGFIIQCTNGAFCYSPSAYSEEEIANFEQHVTQLKAEYASRKS